MVGFYGESVLVGYIMPNSPYTYQIYDFKNIFGNIFKQDWADYFLHTDNSIYLLIICLRAMKWLQVLLFNTNYSIQHYSFVHTDK